MHFSHFTEELAIVASILSNRQLQNLSDTQHKHLLFT